MSTIQAEYRRNLQNNELVIKTESSGREDGYVLRMAEQNRIDGLLSFHSSWKDGELYLHYDVTSRQSLEHAFAAKMMNSDDLLRILERIREVLETMQKYLLDSSQLLFDPKYMFWDTVQKQLYLCCLPGEDQTDSAAEFAEFLLKKLNHEDRQAVEIGYRFYQESLTENFSLKKALKEILCDGKELYEKAPVRTEPVQKGEIQRENPEISEVVRPGGIRKKENFAERIFRVIHPAVLISGLLLMVLLELMFYFRMLNVTEAGGLFFLLAAGEVLINQLWKRSSQPKKSLEEDFYEDNSYEDNSYEESEETRCFVQNDQRQKVRLVCIAGESGNKKNYPDIEIREGELRIGKRKGESDVWIDSPTVSRIHAQLISENGKCYVKDLNSTNGTFHNGQKLNPRELTELSAGDTVSFAEIEYLVYFTRNQ